MTNDTIRIIMGSDIHRSTITLKIKQSDCEVLAKMLNAYFFPAKIVLNHFGLILPLDNSFMIVCHV